MTRHGFSTIPPQHGNVDVVIVLFILMVMAMMMLNITMIISASIKGIHISASTISTLPAGITGRSSSLCDPELIRCTVLYMSLEAKSTIILMSRGTFSVDEARGHWRQDWKGEGEVTRRGTYRNSSVGGWAWCRHGGLGLPLACGKTRIMDVAW